MDKVKSRGTLYGMLGVAAAAALLISALAVAPAPAAKGGGNGGTSGGTLTVSPNPVHVGDGSAPATFTVSGSGFRPGKVLRVSVVGKLDGLHLVTTDSSGAFSTSYTLDLCSGCWYYVEAFEYKGRSKVVLAWTQFSAEP